MELQQIKRFRVAADFCQIERDALDALCSADYRPAAEQLRWLVIQEAQQRGLFPVTNDKTANTYQGAGGLSSTK